MPRSHRLMPLLVGSLLLGHPALAGDDTTWTIDTPEQWQAATGEADGLTVADGLATSTGPEARFHAITRVFDAPRRATSLTLTQSAAWDNWQKVPNVGPADARDAPIFLPIADGNYWFFGSKGRGYNAWHSTDMKTWTDKGLASKDPWATTAEYADGRIFLYYDKPNDQDPHLVIGENLDGQPTWKPMGKVFDDPSHGSDAGAIRTEDGVFHLVYEDWSPIDARRHSWDSPLAGHADSPDGIHGFAYGDNPPAVDQRTRPTGRTGTYLHRYTGPEPLTYEIHEPEQDAYGDYTLIKVGPRFYLFGDYHPAGSRVRLGYFTSDAIDRTFRFVGPIDTKAQHPDPTVGFAEGRFYLIVQSAEWDYTSPGPWVDTVEARAGVDVQGDGSIDRWTDWQVLREHYRQKPGFARLVDADPAAMDLGALPAGLGFTFQFRTTTAPDTVVRPVIDRVDMRFAP